jgi:hypothetical protein
MTEEGSTTLSDEEIRTTGPGGEIRAQVGDTDSDDSDSDTTDSDSDDTDADDTDADDTDADDS